ncbi:MAG: hypothetical protein QOG15_1515 [Solirubrobacteraceae bacterium]|nr:hypothetical protein [Solirubrobacteraceae bacterium]
MSSFAGIFRLPSFRALLVACAVLAAAVTWLSAAPVTSGAKMPKTHRYYWGAWIDTHVNGTQPPWDMSAVKTVESRLGKRMSLIEFGTPMTGPEGRNPFTFPAAQFDAIRRHGSIPFFSWSTHAMRNYGHRSFTLRAIANGSMDELIETWAAAARVYGKPFFLRFNWEMNGDWFPWSERYGDNQPGEYVAAWRHVHDIFERAGVTNATWVWCPVADPKRDMQPLAKLYPGDRYVDWTGIDAYNGGAPWRTLSGVIRATYREIVKIAPAKPMVLGEVGSTESGGNKAKWIRGMFTSLPRDFPKMRAVIWFDSAKVGPGGHRDWVLDSSASAQRAFGRAVAGKEFHGNQFGDLSGGRIPLP